MEVSVTLLLLIVPLPPSHLGLLPLSNELLVFARGDVSHSLLSLFPPFFGFDQHPVVEDRL